MRKKSMSNLSKDQSKNFYEDSYKKHGLRAQRRYPNEEFCRFMGRNFLDSDIIFDARSKLKILETGCGSGANLWMIAKEGFDTYGVDFSEESLMLAQRKLDEYQVKAHLSVQDMSALNFRDDYFDAVVDVFSSYCLNKEQGDRYLKGVQKILKPGGLFFSYFPSKGSDAYQFPEGANFVDSNTLEAIKREDSPFYGHECPFRFMHSREYEKALKALGFIVQYSEVVDKTYRNGQENFSFIVIEAKKLI